MLATGARTPVPVSGKLCGLPGALLVMVSVLFRTPAAVGVKVTFMEQALKDDEIELHADPFIEAEKSPLATALDRLKVPLPMLFTLNPPRLLSPMDVLPKTLLPGAPPFGVTCRMGLVPFVPEPDKGTL